MRTNKELAAAIIFAFTVGLGLGVGLGFSGSERPSTLCDHYPEFCEPCVGSCPQESSGWLCCSETSGICVVANGQCGEGNIFGWCENYTTDPASGAATCHD